MEICAFFEMSALESCADNPLQLHHFRHLSGAKKTYCNDMRMFFILCMFMDLSNHSYEDAGEGAGKFLSQQQM